MLFFEGANEIKFIRDTSVKARFDHKYFPSRFLLLLFFFSFSRFTYNTYF